MKRKQIVTLFCIFVVFLLFPNHKTYSTPLPNVVTAITFKIGNNKYQIDGQEKPFSFPPFIKKGRTMVHLWFISEIFDVQAEYDHKSNGIVMSKRNKLLVMQIDNEDICINGKFSKVDVPPVLKKDLVFVPLRFLMENFFESTIEWESATQKITILYDPS